MKLFKKAYYEKLMMENPKTVRDYQLIIAHANEKIEEIQSTCPHNDQKGVGFIIFCKTCRKVLN